MTKITKGHNYYLRRATEYFDSKEVEYYNKIQIEILVD